MLFSLLVGVRNNDVVAIFTAIRALFLVHEMEDVVEIVLHGGDAARIFAFDDVGHLLGHLEFHLLDGFAVFNDVDGGVRVDEAEEVVVDVDDVVDLDDVFFAHLGTVGVHDEGDVVFRLVKVKVVEHSDAIAGLDVVDDDSFFYTVDF